MRWLDIEDISLALEEKYPEVEILSVRFTDLQKWVMGLEGFDDNPQRCNEKILEAIQAAWLEERGV